MSVVTKSFDTIHKFLNSPRLEFGLRILHDPSIVTDIRRLDGRFLKISAWGIFKFLVEALWKYPGMFDYEIDPSLRGMSELTYMILSLEERVKAARKRGVKIVGKWPANPTDPYFVDGVMALDPFLAGYCRLLAEGKPDLVKRGRARLSEEACPAQAAAYSILDEETYPMDFFYPFIGPWCYDSQYCFEALRHKVDGDYGDHPVFNQRDDRLGISREYLRQELLRFLKRLEELTGKKIDPEALRREFILENKLRRVLREIIALPQEEPPPIDSLAMILSVFICSDWLGDPEAALQVLSRIRDAGYERLAKGRRGMLVQKYPVRILITGIAWGDLGLYNMVDELGGVIVGSDCVYNLFHKDIDTDGDPIDILTDRFLATPYTWQVEERSMWTVNTIRSAKRVDGLIFNCNFGCNYQAAEARFVTDIVKRETGIPCLITDADLPKENRGQMRTRLGAFIELLKERQLED